MRLIAPLLALSLALPAYAQSGSDLIGADPEQIQKVIADEGYPVERTTDGVGDPQLIVKTEGTEYYVQFYGCDDTTHNDCRSIQFLVGFNMAEGMDRDDAMSWTADQRFTSVFLDEENDPFLQMDVNMDGGIAAATLADSLSIWSSALSEFKDYIDW